jgi:hypothetical protein
MWHGRLAREKPDEVWMLFRASLVLPQASRLCHTSFILIARFDKLSLLTSNRLSRHS